jgi:hypothetical protein
MFASSLIPPKIYFFVERFLEKGLWLLDGDNKKIFLLVPTSLRGETYFAPPFNPQNPVSSCVRESFRT